MIQEGYGQTVISFFIIWAIQRIRCYTVFMRKTIYAGTYTGTGSEGIYRFEMDEGILSEAKLLARIENPKYINLTDGIIAAAADNPNGSGIALISREGEILDTISYERRTSCYIGRNGNRLYTANYHDGTVSAAEITEDNRLKLISTVLIRDGAGCHQVLFHGDQILVPCLFLDRVVIFDSDLNRTGSIHFNHGTGPRHGVFTKDGKYLYLISELSNELFVISTDTWEILSSLSVLPNGEKNRRDSAAIRLSDDEKHVYVSTRTMDIISVVEMNDHRPVLKQTVSCGGRHPRDFIISDGYLLSANRFTNNVVSFRLNEDGTVGEKISETKVPEAVSLAAEDCRQS